MARAGRLHADDTDPVLEAQKKKRAEESRKLVEIEVQREEERAFVEANAEASDVDTDDDIDEAAEFEAWQRREWSRFKVDRENREKFIAEREEQERIRNMSEEEKAGQFCWHHNTYIYIFFHIF